MRQDSLISYADMQRMGFDSAFIDDYQGIKREFAPQSGTTADPNGVFISNSNGFYVDTATPRLWFNPVAGVKTGWIALT